MTAKPSRRRKKGRTEPWKIIDTLQQKLANRQQALTLLTEYDLDVEARELALWEEAVDVIRTTTIQQRAIQYITLNKPDDERPVPAEDVLPSAALLKEISLPEMSLHRYTKPRQEPAGWSEPTIPAHVRPGIMADYYDQEFDNQTNNTSEY